MISVDNLSKRYGDYQAVDNVSFNIGKSEIVGILGLNGAGKSTILKVLGTFLLPSAGHASVAGFSVTENPDEVRRNIGYLPDTPPLYNEMTVIPFLKFVARLKDVPQSQVQSFVDDAVSKTNLEEVATFRLGDLSHGFRQRVGIASALVHKPKVLILDEPINGLDPIQIVGMRDLVIGLKQDHTVILSSHILSEITKTCDRMLIIDHGKLIAEGNEKELAGGQSKNMKLTCEVDRLGDGLKAALNKISGLKNIGEKQLSGSTRTRLLLDAEGDIRAEIAAVIVNSGSGLLSLSAEDSGLESLFLEMVGNSDKSKQMEGSK